MKRFVSIFLALVMMCALLPANAFAAKNDFPYDWDDMRDVLLDFNDLCAEYYVYADDEDAQFIEIEGDLSKVNISRYDIAFMRISRLYFEDGNFFYWDEHEAPYYVIYENYKGEWIIDGVVYVEGQVFSYVGIPGESWYFDTSETNIYWSK